MKACDQRITATLAVAVLTPRNNYDRRPWLGWRLAYPVVSRRFSVVGNARENRWRMPMTDQ